MKEFNREDYFYEKSHWINFHLIGKPQFKSMSTLNEKGPRYSLLFESEKFASAMGRMTLETGRLEMTLKSFLLNSGIKVDLSKDSLGLLIAKAGSRGLLNTHELTMFNTIRKKRNYLTHNIYSTITEHIADSKAMHPNLIATDVDSYTHQVMELRKNISELINLILCKEAE